MLHQGLPGCPKAAENSPPGVLPIETGRAGVRGQAILVPRVQMEAQAPARLPATPPSHLRSPDSVGPWLLQSPACLLGSHARCRDKLWPQQYCFPIHSTRPQRLGLARHSGSSRVEALGKASPRAGPTPGLRHSRVHGEGAGEQPVA